MGRLRCAFASLERWRTSLVAGNVTLSRIWEKRQNSSDLSSIKLLRSIQIMGYVPFLLRPILRQRCRSATP